jgi:hypothetical protein
MVSEWSHIDIFGEENRGVPMDGLSIVVSVAMGNCRDPNSSCLAGEILLSPEISLEFRF